MTKSANRRDIARKISEKTGYYIKDIEEILDAEAEAVCDLIDEGYTKIKNHKLNQFEVVERPSKKAWDGFTKKYYESPEKKVVKMKPLLHLEKTMERMNAED